MNKKIYRRVNLAKALILFVFIVIIVLINLIVFSNMKEEKNNINETKVLVEKEAKL